MPPKTKKPKDGVYKPKSGSQKIGYKETLKNENDNVPKLKELLVKTIEARIKDEKEELKNNEKLPKPGEID